ncbi:MAG: hypothetical protein JWQ55_2508 [Rhodopila sp.]|nr:hypothetical protein [Rhodopila sp.]
MTALAQGSAGVALVMCFALLRTGQVSAAAILLAVQSIAVAVTAVILHQPLMAMPPLLLGAGFWLLRRETPIFHSYTAPIGGAKLGIAVGAVLAILCQSQAGLALPSAIVLLSGLLATTRPHPLMQVAALVAAQNGLALAGCLVAQPAVLSSASFPAALLLPLACLVLPLPLAAGLLVPAIASSPNPGNPGWALRLTASWRPRLPSTAAWFGWIEVCLALAIFAATLIVPLDSFASIFAPLLGLDGVLRSCVRQKRHALSPIRRASALLQTGFTVLAVCAPNPIIEWLTVLAAMTMALLPTMSRRWNSAVLAFLATGLSLFGLLLLPAAPSILGYFSLFAGFATVAAIVPDLAAVVVILILRLANQTPWPFSIEALGIGLAIIGLLTCALLLTTPNRSHRTTLLTLSQASIAALAICIGHADGRFAALVLLILLILSRAAARVTVGPVATLAIAGLAGLPPLGVFPGLVLVVLTFSAHNPWLLLPVGAALIPILSASVPRQLPDFISVATVPSIAWLPLLLAILAGYFAPNGLVHWWRILTAGVT